MPKEQPNCCLCGNPCEPWHDDIFDPGGYGHNPDPLCLEGDRCCNDCNARVILARIKRLRHHETLTESDQEAIGQLLDRDEDDPTNERTDQ